MDHVRAWHFAGAALIQTYVYIADHIGHLLPLASSPTCKFIISFFLHQSFVERDSVFRGDVYLSRGRIAASAVAATPGYLLATGCPSVVSNRLYAVVIVLCSSEYLTVCHPNGSQVLRRFIHWARVSLSACP